MPYLLQYSPPPENRRPLILDIDNEPNFQEIARLYPLQNDRRALYTEARERLFARGFIIYDYVFEAVLQRRISLDAASSP